MKDKKEIPYCKNCQFYIEYAPELIQLGNDNEDGHDICGFTINTELNYIGNETFISQGDLIRCEECNSVIKEDKTPIYRKCKAKNRKKNCKDFIPIKRSRLLINKAKYIIITIKNMIKSLNINKSYILLPWLTFNIIFLIHNNVLLELQPKNIFYYFLITIITFFLVMKK